ncbi:EAL domain-containing protein [Paenibacillus hexagrammi]|uniref:EAL domain-containing protein n=1 Tax=Paenibacillus hexagrammi TaxID=2908839 RepID=A0ABY3SBT6_9BACL|nr:EAL domain-containing protein [Paenibacillus sp. YPD9-1]UJF31462.1 EAL domain-containing protein [Paenibacillus sp. YPD9-1]
MEFSTGAIIGMEALLRWSSPVFGKVPPGEFIPLAEETGMIIPLSEWVLLQACTDNKRLLDEGYPPLMVSINISFVHIAQSNFVETITKILERTSLPPHLLCLEITEHAAIQKMEQTSAHMKQLMNLGVRIALDDFGVGNSSLSIIKSLPLNIIKIDRMFVKDIQHNEISSAIFHSILSLIEDLKLVSCVEGIELQEQYELAMQHHCEMAQGFHICRPILLSDLRSFLKKES